MRERYKPNGGKECLVERAIVTGANGFIGKHLVRALLKKNMEVWVIVRDSGKMGDLVAPNLHIVEADFERYARLSEQIQVRDFNVCFHLAWAGTWGELFKEYVLQLQNAKYACDMAVQASRLRCRRFILVSTIVQLEAQKYMCSDDGKLRYSVIYGAAKSISTILCRIVAEQLGMGWNTAVLSSVYGVGDYSKMIENVLIQNFLSGLCPKLVTGNNYYDCTYVEDVVSCLLAIAERGRKDKTYYVGHRQLRTFREIVCELRDVLAPKMELKFGEYPDTASIDYTQIDVESLYNDTGFEPQISLREGISRTATWLKEIKRN